MQLLFLKTVIVLGNHQANVLVPFPYVLFVSYVNLSFAYELKNMESGEQFVLDFDSIIEKLNF